MHLLHGKCMIGDRKAHVKYLDFEVNSFVPQSFVLLILLNTFTIKKLGTGMQKDLISRVL